MNKPIHPAVAEHVMEENERLRGLLRECAGQIDLLIEVYVEDDVEPEDIAISEQIKADIHAALSRQAEPTDTFTAVDMATAAAQGFRDGQAAVEPAPAQDEREAFEAFQSQRPSHWRITNRAAWKAALKYAAENYRPAQTEQQPVAFREARVISFRPGMGEVTFYVKGGVPGFMDPGCTIYVSDAAPIAQTAQQPVLYVSKEALDDQDQIGMHATRESNAVQGMALYTAPQPEQSGLVEAASAVIRVADWWAENEDSPKSALTHFTRAASVLRAALSAQGTNK